MFTQNVIWNGSGWNLKKCRKPLWLRHFPFKFLLPTSCYLPVTYLLPTCQFFPLFTASHTRFIYYCTYYKKALQSFTVTVLSRFYRFFNIKVFLELPCVCCFLHRNCNCNCHSYHWVISSSDKTHHFNMGRY